MSGIATEGAYKTMTHLGLADLPAFRDTSDHGLAQVLQRCQYWETDDDLDWQELPRAKRHDDKSLAVATFTA